MRTTRPALLTLVAALGLSAPLGAQQVVGTLRRDMDSLPVSGALVVVSDAEGREVARSVSSERGAFAAAVPPGGYTIRVLRIGQRPFGPAPATVSAGIRTAVALFLPDDPIVLAALTARVEQHRCGIPPEGSILGLLLAEARKAIALTEATSAEHRIMFMVETWRRRLTPALETLDSTGTVSLDRGWPIRSAPPDSLRRFGFARTDIDDAGRTSTDYYGPDARVLFADWFLETRCLQLRSSREPGLLAVEFAPARRGVMVDIAGRFVFDSTSLALRELQFRWTGLDDWVPSRGPGGFLRFSQLASGEWLAVEWWLRAPVPEATPNRAVLRLKEFLEFGGHVVRNQP